MPFITEEIWHAIYDGRPPLKSIALAAYTQRDDAQLSAEAETEMAVLQDLIVSVRNVRAELKVSPKVRLPIEIFAAPEVRESVKHNAAAVDRLATVDGILFVEHSLAKETNARTTARFEVRVVYEQKVDVAAERERLNKELEKLEREFANAQRQLGNQQFLSKAPASVVEGLRKREAELRMLQERARTALKAFPGE